MEEKWFARTRPNAVRAVGGRQEARERDSTDSRELQRILGCLRHLSPLDTHLMKNACIPHSAEFSGLTSLQHFSIAARQRLSGGRGRASCLHSSSANHGLCGNMT